MQEQYQLDEGQALEWGDWPGFRALGRGRRLPAAEPGAPKRQQRDSNQPRSQQMLPKWPITAEETPLFADLDCRGIRFQLCCFPPLVRPAGRWIWVVGFIRTFLKLKQQWPQLITCVIQVHCRYFTVDNATRMLQMFT